MEKPILPEMVHVNINIFDTWDSLDRKMYSHTSQIIPSKWLKFNGQGKYNEWSWDKKYEKDIRAKLGIFYDGEIKVVEWNILRSVAYLMKSSREIGFDVNSYYTQLEDKDIIYFDTVNIKAI